MKNFALLSGICDGANEAVIVAFTVSERWPWHEVTFIWNLLALLSYSTTQHSRDCLQRHFSQWQRAARGMEAFVRHHLLENGPRN